MDMGTLKSHPSTWLARVANMSNNKNETPVVPNLLLVIAIELFNVTLDILRNGNVLLCTARGIRIQDKTSLENYG
jgi:hypothetical protein